MRQLIFSWKIAERLKKGCAICVYSQDIIGTKPYHCMQASSSLPSELTFRTNMLINRSKKSAKTTDFQVLKANIKVLFFCACYSLLFFKLQCCCLLTRSKKAKRLCQEQEVR